MPTRKEEREDDLSPLFLCIYFGLLFTRSFFDRIITIRLHIQGDFGDLLPPETGGPFVMCFDGVRVIFL